MHINSSNSIKTFKSDKQVFLKLFINNYTNMIEILNKPNEMICGKRTLGEEQQNINNVQFSVQNMSARLYS